MIADDPRGATNPLFNANPFKLGVFGFNGKGAQVSHGPGPEVSWARNIRIGQMADAGGFEAIVPYTRWKGRPQVDAATRHPPHDVFDTYTWAAGMSQATQHSAVFSTTAVPIVHPIVVAKQAATIDHISGGRFALNVVAGWNAPEFAMFGENLKPHDDRYDQAAEWMEVVRRLWTEEEFDFEGRYYKIARGESWPKPVQRAWPAIMNAGGSDRGAHFATKYADICFVIVKGGIDAMAAHVAEYKRLAREEYGREVQVWTTTDVIVRPTGGEAADEARRQQELINPAYLKQLAALRGEQSKPLSIGGTAAAAAATATAKDAQKLIGTPERIVDLVGQLAAAGLDGTLLTSDSLEDELPLWMETVMPLLVQAGLRLPERADRWP